MRRSATAGLDGFVLPRLENYEGTPLICTPRFPFAIDASVTGGSAEAALENHDGIADLRQQQRARALQGCSFEARHACYLLITVAGYLTAMLVGLRLLLELSERLYGPGPFLHCERQPVAHGEITPGTLDSRPEVHCRRGYEFDPRNAKTIRCRLIMSTHKTTKLLARFRPKRARSDFHIYTTEEHSNFMKVQEGSISSLVKDALKQAYNLTRDFCVVSTNESTNESIARMPPQNTFVVGADAVVATAAVASD
eukprot:TRINITY_DN42411_c0_g1_i1.p1 TRINITY_DN42411_c0_g1~~TRINITY_DN42411_c0_g1_i1.p1  ORF type:complete len:253 (+),score=54.92 TRINITY_DN42411_c0_g1_i1:162-920(+)